MEDEITIKSRTSYSLIHIKSSCFFADQALKLESRNKNQKSSFQYQAFCTNSILSTVAFLEANINEFYCDINDGLITTKNEKLSAKIKKMWELNIPRTASFTIFQKYEIALALCEKAGMEKGNLLFANIISLIKIRNSLIHFEPEWNDISSDEALSNDKLFKQLKNKFPLNPFAGSGNAFFPERCIGHGCAEWAIKNALDFVDKFYENMGIKTAYHYQRNELKTRSNNI